MELVEEFESLLADAPGTQPSQWVEMGLHTSYLGAFNCKSVVLLCVVCGSCVCPASFGFVGSMGMMGLE